MIQKDFFLPMELDLNERFQKMPLDEKLIYLIDHRQEIPDEMASQAVDIFLDAGETEYAAVMARDHGMVDKATEILVERGDYLWAALIAKNAGQAEEANRLYREGLGYYIDRKMFGRAISAAEAINLPKEEIQALFERGIEVESQGMNLEHTRSMIDCALDSLEMAILGRDDELSREILDTISDEREKNRKGES